MKSAVKISYLAALWADIRGKEAVVADFKVLYLSQPGEIQKNY
jgi:hypothetical protein